MSTAKIKAAAQPFSRREDALTNSPCRFFAASAFCASQFRTVNSASGRRPRRNDLFHILFKFHSGQHDHMPAAAAFDTKIDTSS